MPGGMSGGGGGGGGGGMPSHPIESIARSGMTTAGGFLNGIAAKKAAKEKAKFANAWRDEYKGNVNRIMNEFGNASYGPISNMPNGGYSIFGPQITQQENSGSSTTNQSYDSHSLPEWLKQDQPLVNMQRELMKRRQKASLGDYREETTGAIRRAANVAEGQIGQERSALARMGVDPSAGILPSDRAFAQEALNIRSTMPRAFRREDEEMARQWLQQVQGKHDFGTSSSTTDFNSIARTISPADYAKIIAFLQSPYPEQGSAGGTFGAFGNALMMGAQN